MARVKRQSGQTSPATKKRLVTATVEVLATEGIKAATIRNIADTAGCNSALISYHFGSLNALLLAALDASSAARLSRYSEVVAGVRNLRQLRGAMARLYREDRAAGHVRVLAEMMAAGLMDPSLGREVAARVDPWVGFTEETLKRVVPGAVLRRRLPVREAAYGLVAMFLGMEALGTLAGDHSRGDAVVDRLSRIELATTSDET